MNSDQARAICATLDIKNHVRINQDFMAGAIRHVNKHVDYDAIMINPDSLNEERTWIPGRSEGAAIAAALQAIVDTAFPPADSPKNPEPTT